MKRLLYALSDEGLTLVAVVIVVMVAVAAYVLGHVLR